MELQPTGKEMEQLSQKQLLIYAQEVQHLYQRERDLRQHMARKQEVLEQRVRELQALNALFRRHLEERNRSRAAYAELVEGMQRLAMDAQRLAALAQEHPLLLEQRLQEPAPSVVHVEDVHGAA